MDNKIIAYVDGSFKDGFGGWGMAYFYNRKEVKVSTGFGKVHVRTSVQAEVVACIKALEYIKVEPDIDYIEIHTDCLSIVEVMNKVSQYYYSSFEQVLAKLGKQDITLIKKLIKLIMKSDVNVAFVKAKKKDTLNKKVHCMAKKAIDRKDLEDAEFHIWSEEQCTYRTIHKRDADSNNILLKQEDLVAACRESIHYDKCTADQDLVTINTKDILLCEDIHLKTKVLNIDGLMYNTKKRALVEEPITVRKLDGNLYGLVLGLRVYCIAKILNIENVKAYVTDLSRKELIKIMLAD